MARDFFSKLIFVGLVCLLVQACASSGPKTTFYSLFASDAITTGESEIGDKKVSIGVGPIILPEYLKNIAIVSETSGQEIRVSGYHAWAGDLNDSISRVLADNLSTSFALDSVWAFPWDNRVRPNYQIRIVFESFSGVRGGDVTLKAKWTLLDKCGENILMLGRERFNASTASDYPGDYVSALNLTLTELSQSIAQKIQQKLN